MDENDRVETECCGAAAIYDPEKATWICTECGKEVESPVEVEARPFPDSWKLNIVMPEKEDANNERN